MKPYEIFKIPNVKEAKTGQYYNRQDHEIVQARLQAAAAIE
ncbi:hypothetical protein [Pelosinus propionicus]|nr:hypothetical protein [Pelosinus propionicus]